MTRTKKGCGIGPEADAAWTDERERRLCALWAENLSCSEIAKLLGGISRNAVIGKVHRLGLGTRPARRSRATRRQARRGAPQQPRRGIRREANKAHPWRAGRRNVARPQSAMISPVSEIWPVRRLPWPTRASALPQPFTDLAPETSRQAVPFLARGPRQCAWPLWREATAIAERLVCGGTTEARSSWCARHAAFAFTRLRHHTTGSNHHAGTYAD